MCQAGFEFIAERFFPDRLTSFPSTSRISTLDLGGKHERCRAQIAMEVKNSKYDFIHKAYNITYRVLASLYWIH